MDKFWYGFIAIGVSLLIHTLCFIMLGTLIYGETFRNPLFVFMMLFITSFIHGMAFNNLNKKQSKGGKFTDMNTNPVGVFSR